MKTIIGIVTYIAVVSFVTDEAKINKVGTSASPKVFIKTIFSRIFIFSFIIQGSNGMKYRNMNAAENLITLIKFFKNIPANRTIMIS